MVPTFPKSKIICLFLLGIVALNLKKGGPYYLQTSLIYRAYQRTGFLHDRDLRHETVNNFIETFIIKSSSKSRSWFTGMVPGRPL